MRISGPWAIGPSSLRSLDHHGPEILMSAELPNRFSELSRAFHSATQTLHTHDHIAQGCNIVHFL
jgi:hypothetical protein